MKLSTRQCGTQVIASGTGIVSLVYMGTAYATPANTDANGDYAFTNIYLPVGDEISVLVYLNTNSGNLYQGSTVTVTDSVSFDITGLDIFAGGVGVTTKGTDTVKTDGGIASIDNQNLYDARGALSVDRILYSVTGGNLTLGNATYTTVGLHIPSCEVFVPGGNVTVSGDWTNNGTLAFRGVSALRVINRKRLK